MEPTSDTAALDAMRAGDERGLVAIHTRHFEAVYRLAFRALGDVDEADSVTQDVFEVAWRSRHKLEAVHGSVRPWLLRTCQFKVEHVLRRTRRRPQVTAIPESDPTMPPMEEGVVEHLEAAQRLGAMSDALERMPALDRRSFSLTVLSGRTPEQAAAILGISVDSVRKRVKRTRSRLRAHAGLAER